MTSYSHLRIGCKKTSSMKNWSSPIRRLHSTPNFPEGFPHYDVYPLYPIPPLSIQIILLHHPFYLLILNLLICTSNTPSLICSWGWLLHSFFPLLEASLLVVALHPLPYHSKIDCLCSRHHIIEYSIAHCEF